MELEKLLEMQKKFQGNAQLTLDNAAEAMKADDWDKAAALQEEADGWISKATQVDVQIQKLNAVKSLTKVREEESKADPVILPLDGEDAPTKSTKTEEMPVAKAVYQLRYGDTGAAVKAVAADLYGTDYELQRGDQMDAFVKFVRFGGDRLTAREQGLLQTLILLPDAIEREVQAGNSVKSIKVDLQEMVNDLGGYLVPEDYRTQIITRLMGLTAVRPRAMVVTTNRDAVEWPKLEGGNAQYTSAVRVTWVDEIPSSATVAQTNPTFGMLRIPVYTVMARTDISRNLLEDSAFNILQVLARLFAEAMAIDEDAQFVSGRGGGTPRGILAGGSTASPAPDTGVQEAVTGNASALEADGLMDLVYKLDTQYRQNAQFMFAKNTIRDIRKLKDGESRYLWSENLQGTEPARLLGYPTAETENMPAVAANAYPILFGDFGGYLIVDRVGMSVERVADTTTVGTNKVAIFARRRLGGGVIEPWRFAAQKVAAS